MTDAPDRMIVYLLQREAYEELGRVAMLAEDYALKLFDATEARNAMQVAGRLQQLRFCTLAMIQTFNLFLRAKPDDQGVPEGRGPADADCADQRTGDVVA